MTASKTGRPKAATGSSRRARARLRVVALPLLLLASACATPLPIATGSPVECHPMFVRRMRPWGLAWIPGDPFTCANARAIETHLRWIAAVGAPPSRHFFAGSTVEGVAPADSPAPMETAARGMQPL